MAQKKAMRLFLAALCLSLAFEGLCFALFPGLMRQAMLDAASRGDSALRALGATALVLAAILACFFRIANLV